MRIRRTGAKRGDSPVWYVQASSAGEQLAFQAGLIEDRSPDARWRYVMAWGFCSRSAAEETLPDLYNEMVEALRVLREQVWLAADAARDFCAQNCPDIA
jgi:hypothetical protein